jgi:hypothetical protein
MAAMVPRMSRFDCFGIPAAANTDAIPQHSAPLQLLLAF